MDSKLICIVDGNLMAHKSLHTLELSLEDGTPVGVIYGVLRQLVTISDKFDPDQIVVVWDGGSAKRKKIYPQYKANRTQSPLHSIFHQQLLVLEQVLYDIGLSQILVPGEEADDVIGSFCHNNQGAKIIIVTCDHDFYQLITSDVLVYAHKGANTTIYTEKVIKDTYGLEPSKLNDMYALTGDGTDNIAGIKGIGPKTASKIIQKYQSIENVLKQKNIDGFSKSINDSILSSPSMIELNKFLLTIDKKVLYNIKHGNKNLPLVRLLFSNYFNFKYFVDKWDIIEKLSEKSA